MTKMYLKVRNFFVRDECGATMVEYGLMVALIAVIAMVGAGALGLSVNQVFLDIAAAINPGP